MKFYRKLDRISLISGGIISFLCVILVFNVFIAVLQRYLLNNNYIWQAELSEVLCSLIFLIGAGYTLYFNGHVRVDILYEKFSSKVRSYINMIGVLTLLMPMCGAIIYFSSSFVISSWAIFESSAEYSGIVGVFLLKTLIWFFSLFLLISGLSIILSSLRNIRSKA